MNFYKYKIVLFTSFLLYLFLLIGSHGVASELDSSFGTDGLIVSDFGFGDDEIFAVTSQDDGKIVVAGYVNNGAVKNIAVARYLSDGTADISFNYDGFFTLSLGGGDSQGNSLLIQEDGTILVAATVADGSYSVAMIRLTPDGYADAAFGDNGVVDIPLEATEVQSSVLMADKENRILIGGTVLSEGAEGSGYVTRLSSAGIVDDSFGEDGVAVVSGDDGVVLNSIVPLDGGKILGAGSMVKDGQIKPAILRLTTEGQVDETFGTAGEVVFELGTSEAEIKEILVDSQGNLFFAGALKVDERLNSFVGKADLEGALDQEFGENGIIKSELAYDNQIQDMVLLDNDSLVMAGFAAPEEEKDLYVMSVELSSDAPSESTAAETTTDLASMDDVGNALTVMPSSQVIVAGSTENGSDSDFALLSYLSAGVSLSNSSSASGEAGNRTSGYYIETTNVSDISRVGAVSGGWIVDTDTLSCPTSCTKRCTSAAGELDKTCYDTCFADCEGKEKITSRGVVYAVSQYPVYRTEEADATDEENSGGIFPPTDNENAYETVRSGQTSDGDGLGRYSSDMLEITPDTTYYVRAYAVLTDGTVIYGNVVSFTTNDVCFIATAAYGSILENQVVILRNFRDRFMLTHDFGRVLVATYYRYSPPIAEVVKQNVLFRSLVKIVLFPFIAMAYVALNFMFVLKWSLLIASLLLGGAVIRKAYHMKVV